MRHRILLAFAHPDDESFGPAGTIAKYSKMGHEVTLICATKGESGKVINPKVQIKEDLTTVREKELRCSARVLGINRIIYLGYRDSGMEGRPANKHPDAFINVPDEEVVATLVKWIRELRPTIVLSFEPGGGYGHPDHKKISRCTEMAVHRASEGGYRPDLGNPWQVSRFIYTAISKSQLITMRNKLQELGLPTEGIDGFLAMGAGWDDKFINLVVDISETIQHKWNALRCHRTQVPDNSPFFLLPENIRNKIFRYETFAIAFPQPTVGKKYADFFEDLDLS